MSTMVAARAHTGESEFRLEEIERPQAGPGEVLLEVKSAGLAVGLIDQWQRGMYPIMPRTLGHEAAGFIAEVGSGVTNVEQGDRVRLNPNLCCNACEQCLAGLEALCTQHCMIGQMTFGPEAFPLYERYHNGALANYVLAPGWAVDKLPEAVSFDAACKVHDLANAVRVLRVLDPRPGSTVVLTAATGAIGSLVARVAPLFGIQRIIAVARSAEKLEEIRQLDPDLIDPIATNDLGENWGNSGALTRAIKEKAGGPVQYVVDFYPEGPGTWQAVQALRQGGTAVLMGSNMGPVPVASLAFMFNCWTVKGTRNCTHRDAVQSIEWLADGTIEIDDLITHRFSLDDVNDAAKAVLERSGKTWLVVVNP